MNRPQIEAELARLSDARKQWSVAQARFESDFDAVMSRLINEALVQRMSLTQIAAAVGVPPSRARSILRKHGFKPSEPAGVLAAQAADVLTENAALLGVEPSEMDLTSPLAYLPMGSDLRAMLADRDESDQ